MPRWGAIVGVSMSGNAPDVLVVFVICFCIPESLTIHTYGPIGIVTLQHKYPTLVWYEKVNEATNGPSSGQSGNGSFYGGVR